MLHEHHRFSSRSLFALDVALLALASWLSHHATQAPAGTVAQTWWFVALACVAWWIVSVRLDVYHSRRAERLYREVVALAEGIVVSVGCAAVASALWFDQVPVDVGLVLVVTLLGGILSRAAIRHGLRHLRTRSHDSRQVLLVGRGRTAHGVADTVRANAHFGIRLIGDLTFDGEDTRSPADGVRALGKVGDLQKVLSEHPVDEVIVCPSEPTPIGQIEEVIQTCEAIGAPCRLVPDFLAARVARPTVSWFGHLPTFTFVSGPDGVLQLSLERAIDFVGAAVGIVLLLPAFVLCALAVKLTSRGPVLFRQVRSGLRGRPFVCYKFRSTVVDAEQEQRVLDSADGQQRPVFETKGDPRTTPVGRFLRRFGVDELPQLFNVLRGDMSLVGPRPPLPAEVARYDWWQRRRLSVKPGLTSIWQASERNAISFDRWMELDMEYIDGWCLALDVKPSARTFGTAIKGTGV